jgi:alkylation response protein AidB-like acyl-CoA dehydrogenase
LSGNPGLSRANALQRHYRDVLCSRIHTPQNDTILVNSGRAAFAARAAGKTSPAGEAGILSISAKEAP